MARISRSPTPRRRSTWGRRRPNADGRLWHPEVMTTQVQTVLVVEDESSIASFVALYLKNAGYQVRTVGTGESAPEQLAAGRPDLGVLDLMLPEPDPIQVCRPVRESSEA